MIEKIIDAVFRVSIKSDDFEIKQLLKLLFFLRQSVIALNGRIFARMVDEVDFLDVNGQERTASLKPGTGEEVTISRTDNNYVLIKEKKMKMEK